MQYLSPFSPVLLVLIKLVSSDWVTIFTWEIGSQWEHCETVRTLGDSERMLPEHCQSSEKWNGNMTNISRPTGIGKQNSKSPPHHTPPHHTTLLTLHIKHQNVISTKNTYMIFSGVETWCHCLSFLKEQKYKLNSQEVLHVASNHSVWRTTPSVRKRSLENPPKPSKGWESDLLSVHPSVASVSAPAGTVFKGELNVSRVYRAG